MEKALIIVESPAKIKTLKKFLGSGYQVASSYGHVRDLPESEFGIDVEHEFEPKYVTLPNKKDVIADLKKAASTCDVVYLSPDPDREGEAIAWHISHILPKNTKIKRVTFNSITKEAVQDALKHPREIDVALVNAQQARRLLDRLVGYSISPLLNRRLRRGRGKSVSAGRVQSAALKLVVDREKEIEAFIPKEFWIVWTQLLSKKSPKSFTANLFSVDGKRIEREPVADKKEDVDYILLNHGDKVTNILNDLKGAVYKVTRIEKKEKKRNPEAPFITSTLQQEASRHFRFSPSKTMQIAQTLYEGIELGNNGAEGLITYMRTDSVRIADEAVRDVRGYIEQKYGKNFLSDAPRSFHVKKSAQDAHEAIRPTNLLHDPESIQPYLTREQYLLYSLIWKRFLAGQMAPAIYDTVSVDITAKERYLFRATGSQIKFQGFLAVYEEKQDEESDDGKEKMLPHLEENEILDLHRIEGEQSFTKPPARFTEASLVKELEKSGIGRPSTYATIMNKIQSRDYTTKEQGRLKPTELGRLVTDILESAFTEIVNINFTASMEDALELIAENQKDWKEILSNFWTQFSPTLQKAEKSTEFVPKVTTEHICPKCGGHLQKIWFKHKYFLGCENYPSCDYKSSIEEMTFDKTKYVDDFNWDQTCSKCGKPMKVRHGKFGAFLGCTGYPECKGLVNIPTKEEAQQETVSCPAIGCPGHLVKKRSRFGKFFYSCSEFPACDVIGNDVEKMKEKYINHPQTAYQKKAKETSKKETSKKKSKEDIEEETNQKRRPTMVAKRKTARKARKAKTAKRKTARR